MFVGGVERREETECVDTTEQHGDEERDREKVVIMVVFLEDSRRRRRTFRVTAKKMPPLLWHVSELSLSLSLFVFSRRDRRRFCRSQSRF